MDEIRSAPAGSVIAVAGLLGAVGVMAAAGASHGEQSRNLAAIALICLSHAPTLLALGLAGRGRVLGIGAVVLAAGTLLFVADLGVREWIGLGIFPGAAPLGGVGMIGGWIAVGLGGAMMLRGQRGRRG